MEMKWYAIMMLGILGVLIVGDTIEKGPLNCAEACKTTGRAMVSYSITAGCECGEVRR